MRCSVSARFRWSGADQEIAWQAHIGGFLAGLLLFTAFDPVMPRREFDTEPNCNASREMRSNRTVRSSYYRAIFKQSQRRFLWATKRRLDAALQ